MAAESVYPSTKTCTKCRDSLPLTDFCKQKHTPDGLSYICRACQSIRYKEWLSRPGNQERQKANWNRHWRKSRGFAGYLRSQTPCQLCGETKATLLDFHHIDPETKVAKVSEIKGLREIISEAQKCTILCKKCHMGLHHEGLDGSHLQPLSFEYIDTRFTEYARDFTMKNG